MSARSASDASSVFRPWPNASFEQYAVRSRRPTPRTLHHAARALELLMISGVGYLTSRVPAFAPHRPMFSTRLGMGLFTAAVMVSVWCLHPRRGRSDFGLAPEISPLSGLWIFVLLLSVSSCYLSIAQYIDGAGRAELGISTDLPNLIAWAAISAALSACLWAAVTRFSEILSCGQRVLVVGSGSSARRMADAVDSAPNAIWQLAGFLDDSETQNLDRLREIVGEKRVEVVAIAVDGSGATERISGICGRLADYPVRLSLGLDVVALTRGLRSSGCIGPIELFDVRPFLHDGMARALKRAIDVSIGSMAVLLTFPVMMVATIALWLESPGPIFFTQWRFGVGSRAIRVLKFRTMHVNQCDAAGEMGTEPRDARVTRVGRVLRRLSIDELPQLFNVLRGDMSLVGPRPHPLHMRVCGTYYFDLIEQYRARHLVRPGITGWAQVNGSRGKVDDLAKARRRVDLDLWYIEHWSLWLDLKIMLMTLGAFTTLNAD